MTVIVGGSRQAHHPVIVGWGAWENWKLAGLNRLESKLSIEGRSEVPSSRGIVLLVARSADEDEQLLEKLRAGELTAAGRLARYSAMLYRRLGPGARSG